MATRNAIVGFVSRIEPGPERVSAEEFVRKYPNGVSIEFEGQQRARLLPSDRSAGLLQIMDQLQQLGAPVYVEVSPENNAITRLLIPLVSRVTKISDVDKDEINVELQASHARHVLRRPNPDFSQLLATLRSAQEKNTTLIITETDDHEVIDARPSPRETNIPSAVPPQPTRNSGGWFRRLCRRWFVCCCCVSPRRAKQLFDLVSATTCNPLTVPPPCIPFLYPDDGCWARAHEMCRLMIAAGAKPRKVWIDGHLHVNTKNNPNCFVNWGWHVAPTLCVARGFCRSEEMVIDPSLFNGPVTKAMWKNVQGDPSATLTDTDASLYWRNFMPTDPGYVDTNFRLQYYRLQLQNRSIQFGPPPYANCP